MFIRKSSIRTRSFKNLARKIEPEMVDGLGLVTTIWHGCKVAVSPSYCERTEAEGRFGEVDGHTKPTLMLGLERETM